MDIEIQLDQPLGLEIRLTGIPFDMPDAVVKEKLARNYLDGIRHRFLVVFEPSTEDFFWKSFDDPKSDRTRSARLIIPNDDHGGNPGAVLIGGTVNVRHDIELQAERVKTVQTSNKEFKELRQPESVEPRESIHDGQVGKVLSISCGRFDEERRFETHYTWKATAPADLGPFNYFGHVQPKKFTAGLTEVSDKWEYMELYAENIRGLVFERPKDPDQRHRVAYFVVDKPPQFYLYALAKNHEGQKQQANRMSHVHSRTPSPSMPGIYPPPSGQKFGTELHRSAKTAIAEVNWVIQWSRVYRIQYVPIQELNFDSYQSHLSKEQEITLFCFDHPIIERSPRTPIQVQQTMIANTTSFSNLAQDITITVKLSIYALLLNCNAAPTSAETGLLIDSLIDRGKRGSGLQPNYIRAFCNTMIKFAQDVGTEHLRSLERFHRLLEASAPKCPHKQSQRGTRELQEQYRRMFESHEWKFIIAGTPKYSSLGVFELQIYPSHVELQGPFDPPPSFVIDTHKKRLEDFLRVRFVDNTGKSLKHETGVDIDIILEERVRPILWNVFQPLNQLLNSGEKYEFLGYSMSGLKKRKCVWFFRYTKADWIAKKIRDQIGDWSYDDTPSRNNRLAQDPPSLDEELDRGPNAELAKDPSKWGARLSMAFTESIFVQNLRYDEFEICNDFPHDPDIKLKNTDGCGLITSELEKAINNVLERNGFARSNAFQIRFEGIKGVVYLGSPSLFAAHCTPGVKMLVRESQVKFVCNNRQPQLRVVSTVGDGHESLFFDAALKAFEDMGANTGAIEEIFRKAYRHLTTNSVERLDILHQIFRLPDDERETGVKSRYILLKLATRLAKGPLKVKPGDYSNSFLHLYLARLAEKANWKDLFRIPIPGSCNVLGLTDDYQVLEKDEIFVRTRKQTMPHGLVFVYRDPIIHIGDIQTATAVDEVQLRERMELRARKDKDGCPNRENRDEVNALLGMNNVVFFSQFDSPPLPNRLSGGDLDGDRFEIIPKDCSIWKDALYQTEEPATYDNEGQAAKKKMKERNKGMKPFDINEVADFIPQYIRNDCFDVLQDKLMCLADQSPRGLRDDVVKGMGKWLSKAVDYAKSGQKVDLAEDVLGEEKFQTCAKPDFLRAFGRRSHRHFRGEYYQSPQLLGRLYREFEGQRYDTPDIAIDNTNIQAGVSKAWQEWFRGELTRNRDVKLVKYFQHLYVTNEYGHNVTDEYGNYRIEAIRDDLDDEPDYLWIQEVVIEEQKQYMELRNRETVSGNFELDLFLGKKLRDFPMRFINKLFQKITGHLCSQELAEFLDTSLVRARCLRKMTRAAILLVYKHCLFIAWDVAIKSSQKRVEKEGQGYAFICLYALECYKLPILESYRRLQKGAARYKHHYEKGGPS